MADQMEDVMTRMSVKTSLLGLFVAGGMLVVAGCGGSTAKKNPQNDMGPGTGDMAQSNPGDMNQVTTGFSCSTGTLYAGAPVDTSPGLGAEAANNSVLIGDPPVHWETLVFSGNTLFTRSAGEIWMVDTTAASPMQTRVVTPPSLGSPYTYTIGAPGSPIPCTSASFTETFGLAAMSDGSLVVADYWGNGVVKISNPTNAGTCSVQVLAGNGVSMTGIDPSDNATLPPSGSANGNGTAATFQALGALAVDSSGVVYVIDQPAGGTTLLRKIDTQNSNAVTTLATLNTTITRVFNLTMIGNALYAVGDDGNNTSYVVKVDTSSGALTTVYSGQNQDGWPPESGPDSPDIAGITTDGKNLIVSGTGNVWYLTTSGTLTAIAGGTPPLNADFPEAGYDPNASHPAFSLELVSDIDAEETKGSFDHITYHNGAVYYRGYSQGVGFFVEKIACQ